MNPLRVLMLGWEFPPFIAGGLGVACRDLSTGLSREGVEITFVMPHVPEGASSPHVKLRGANEVNVRVRHVDSILTPYMTNQNYHTAYQRYRTGHPSAVYGRNMGEEIERYTLAAGRIAAEEDHDIIHAHDWMTFQAAARAKKRSKKPLVVHVHATEHDRTGGKPNEYIKRIEQEGLDAADHIITISEYMKRQIITNYRVDAAKVSVIHWGIDSEAWNSEQKFVSPLSSSDKIVLFIGRMTIQKGPDYFVEAAQHVLAHEPNTRFVMAGDGDMMDSIISKVISLGMANRFSFTGFLRGDAVHKAYQMADCYVMPSVSEPFGLVALEAASSNVPIILSRTSGVSEVMNHALRVDFWDTKQMANKIVGVLRHTSLARELKHNGLTEVRQLTINKPATKTIEVYNHLGVRN